MQIQNDYGEGKSTQLVRKLRLKNNEQIMNKTAADFSFYDRKGSSRRGTGATVHSLGSVRTTPKSTLGSYRLPTTNFEGS